MRFKKVDRIKQTGTVPIITNPPLNGTVPTNPRDGIHQENYAVHGIRRSPHAEWQRGPGWCWLLCCRTGADSVEKNASFAKKACLLSSWSFWCGLLSLLVTNVAGRLCTFAPLACVWQSPVLVLFAAVLVAGWLGVLWLISWSSASCHLDGWLSASCNSSIGNLFACSQLFGCFLCYYGLKVRLTQLFFGLYQLFTLHLIIK